MHRPTAVADCLADCRIDLVVSRYHADVTVPMRDGAIAAFRNAGGGERSLRILEAPGAFELTCLCKATAEDAEVDGVVAIGCVITGETPHNQYINASVAHGLTQIVLATGKPVGFGLITCGTLEQARARAGGEKGNKGVEAMHAVLHTIATLRAVRGTHSADGPMVT